MSADQPAPWRQRRPRSGRPSRCWRSGTSASGRQCPTTRGPTGRVPPRPPPWQTGSPPRLLCQFQFQHDFFALLLDCIDTENRKTIAKKIFDSFFSVTSLLSLTHDFLPVSFSLCWVDLSMMLLHRVEQSPVWGEPVISRC